MKNPFSFSVDLKGKGKIIGIVCFMILVIVMAAIIFSIVFPPIRVVQEFLADPEDYIDFVMAIIVFLFSALVLTILVVQLVKDIRQYHREENWIPDTRTAEERVGVPQNPIRYLYNHSDRKKERCSSLLKENGNAVYTSKNLDTHQILSSKYTFRNCIDFVDTSWKVSRSTQCDINGRLFVTFRINGERVRKFVKDRGYHVCYAPEEDKVFLQKDGKTFAILQNYIPPLTEEDADGDGKWSYRPIRMDLGAYYGCFEVLCEKGFEADAFLMCFIIERIPFDLLEESFK